MSDHLTTDIERQHSPEAGAADAANRRRRPPLVTRPQAIGTAYDLVAAHGPGGLSMRKLASSLHVSLPTVYTAVASKEDLVHRLVERLLSEIGDAMAPVSRSEGSPAERFERLVGTVVTWAEQNPNLAEFLLQSTLSADVPTPSGDAVSRDLTTQLSADLAALIGDIGGLDRGIALAFSLVQLRATLALSREPALAAIPTQRWEQVGAATLLAGLRLLASPRL